MPKKFKVIRSGKNSYPYHEADLDKNTRYIVQSNGRGWYGYKWTNPPEGSVLLDCDDQMTEQQALEWLKAKLSAGKTKV